jgi:hypothetical protein
MWISFILSAAQAALSKIYPQAKKIQGQTRPSSCVT